MLLDSLNVGDYRTHIGEGMGVHFRVPLELYTEFGESCGVKD